MSQVTIGIDVATAGVRAVAVGATGRVLATAACELPAPTRDAHGHSEQDARTWWPATETAVGRVTAELPGRGAEVGAVAVAATSGTIVAVDSRGEPVTPALMYDDRRGATLNSRAAEYGARRWRAMGMAVTPTAAIGRIAWLREAAPDAAGIKHTPELVGAKLLGETPATDSSHALKSGYDLLAHEWPADIFDRLGVPAHWLPDVVAPTTVLGEICSPVAGLPPGCLVVAGMTDGCAGQIATGAVAPGQFVGILGTTYVLKGVTADLVPDPTGALYSHRHPDGWWLPGGASNTGGEAIAGSPSITRLDAEAAARGPAATVTYPLTRTGERFPFVASDARGFTLGRPADDAESHRSRLEGVAFVERLALDHLRRLGITVDAPLFAAGGGSRSAVWSRIRATVSGLGLRVAPRAESGYGAALLAAAASSPGGVATVGAAWGTAEGTLIEPDPGETDVMWESYRRFCAELHGRGWIDDDLLRCATSNTG